MECVGPWLKNRYGPSHSGGFHLSDRAAQPVLKPSSSFAEFIMLSILLADQVRPSRTGPPPQ
jgi:hypothetical protein